MTPRMKSRRSIQVRNFLNAHRRECDRACSRRTRPLGISTMLASQLDPDATLYYPMIILERAFFAAGKLADTAKMRIGSDLFYMVRNIESRDLRLQNADPCATSLTSILARGFDRLATFAISHRGSRNRREDFQDYQSKRLSWRRNT